MENQPNNPSHGVKLKQMIVELVDYYGWEHLGYKIPIGCFKNNPSIGSSITFLRRHSWAKNQVQNLYIEMKRKQ
ncbi:VF530 family protein [Aureivirga marina]|uniref:VF530 family protein n=1 Tax=Aureivirga marina TaxID=1182451 RepID=UPI0018CA2677|nr:VF530 family protein [Aureivirga marina]